MQEALRLFGDRQVVVGSGPGFRDARHELSGLALHCTGGATSIPFVLWDPAGGRKLTPSGGAYFRLCADALPLARRQSRL